MSDHTVTIGMSHDGAHTFGAITEHDLGDTGQFMVRVVRRRMGTSRQFQPEIRVSSPRKSDLLAASIRFDSE